jgi:hypothetical protein
VTTVDEMTTVDDMTTGNIHESLALFDGNLTPVVNALSESPFVELSPPSVVLHSEPR